MMSQRSLVVTLLVASVTLSYVFSAHGRPSAKVGKPRRPQEFESVEEFMQYLEDLNTYLKTLRKNRLRRKNASSDLDLSTYVEDENPSALES